MEMTEEEIESLKRFEMPMLKIAQRIGNFIETEIRVFHDIRQYVKQSIA